MRRIVVIGGGAAAMSAASAARRDDSGLDVVVLERAQNVAYGMCGLPYLLAGVTEQAESLPSYPDDFFRDERQIDTKLGAEAVDLDPAQRTVTYADWSGQTGPTYDALVVASGAGPVVPAIPGRDDPRVFTIRKMEDAIVLRTLLASGVIRRAVVAGGDYVGLEMTEALRARNVEVTLVEASSRLLPGFDLVMGEKLLEEVRSHGVDVRRKSTVRPIERCGPDLTEQVGAEHLTADIVIMAGWRQAGWWCSRTAGASVDPSGALLVHAPMQTTLPCVYAAGDCSLHTI